ncbi:MAG TPA: DUF2179 domain-containing protein [Thermoanaerobaculia bacterium]|nr:DUF2179 domain-containing protein [Thermoanaerobaculia bacterium]
MDLNLPYPLMTVPLLIFLARLCDVPLATLRIILLSRGLRRVAPLVGFFEALVWLLAIGQVMQHLDRWTNYLAYAGGFAAGTWVGILVEGRLALGLLAVRIITQEDAPDLIERLRAKHFGVTDFAARGLSGNVRLIFTVIQRKDQGQVLEIIRAIHPKAFVSVSDVRSVSEGFLPARSGGGLFGFLGKRR